MGLHRAYRTHRTYRTSYKSYESYKPYKPRSGGNRVMSVESLTPSICVLALAEGSGVSATALMASLYVFALAAFLGYQVISRVPPLLHTPLMWASSALSAISLVC